MPSYPSHSRDVFIDGNGSRERYFGGLRPYLLCAADEMPLGFCPTPGKKGKHGTAAAMLANTRPEGRSGLRQTPRVRRRIESSYSATKSRLSVEEHGGYLPSRIRTRVCGGLLAFAAGFSHSWHLRQTGQIDPSSRWFVTYAHCARGNGIGHLDETKPEHSLQAFWRGTAALPTPG